MKSAAVVKNIVFLIAIIAMTMPVPSSAFDVSKIARDIADEVVKIGAQIQDFATDLFVDVFGSDSATTTIDAVVNNNVKNDKDDNDDGGLDCRAVKCACSNCCEDTTTCHSCCVQNCNCSNNENVLAPTKQPSSTSIQKPTGPDPKWITPPPSNTAAISMDVGPGVVVDVEEDPEPPHPTPLPTFNKGPNTNNNKPDCRAVKCACKTCCEDTATCNSCCVKKIGRAHV